MRLQEWMKRERYSDRFFTNKLNELLNDAKHKTVTWRAVIYWRQGTCVPRPAVVAAIAQLTGGEVTYDDHVAARTMREAGL